MRALADYLDQGNRVGVPGYHGLLAEIEAAAGAPDSALTLIGQGLAFAQETEGRLSEPYLHRLRGEILLRRDPSNPAPAEEAFQRAIAVARQQGARSCEPARVAVAGQTLPIDRPPAEAHAVLAPALEGFSPTPEMPEIAEAQALLTALAATDEVKVEAAHRQRLTQLHVSYGNALIAARGYGAPETTEAFARARESASGDKDAPGRLAADYGLWVGSFVRGELPSMRAHAAAFLSDLEARPDLPEAGVAHRAAGITCWFAGEYREARDHLERGLALFQPGRDDDLAFRFGMDPGIAAMANLAIASWPLGEVDRAMSLIDPWRRECQALPHIGTLSFGRMHVALFELMRGDHARGAPNAFELARLAREHELPLWGAFGVFLEVGRPLRAARPAGGSTACAAASSSLREQNVLIFDGLIEDCAG